ncbi:transcription factor TAFII-31, partial [Rhodotorula sp. JG-1b]
PRDARLIALILAAAGAEDCEEGVVRMLLEFAHRYTSDILTDSLMYAEHARAGSTSTAPIVPSVDDVRLAVQARTEGAQLPKEVRIFLLQLATTVNSVPLPPVPEVYGIRLPPPAQRLTAPNFSIVPR